jgi:hypothetical protein
MSSSLPVEAQQAAHTHGLRLRTRVGVVAARFRFAGSRSILALEVVRSSLDWDLAFDIVAAQERIDSCPAGREEEPSRTFHRRDADRENGGGGPTNSCRAD